MRGIDLFCGIGGFHYAAKENGIEIVFASEIDKYAQAEYELNHGLKPAGDITRIYTKDIPDHDILMGGFPCQSFSIAGNRKGLADTRGKLFFDITRILRDKKPEYFLLENVKGLLSHDGGETIKIIESGLAVLDYWVKMAVLDAKYFGVPQSRKRLFIVGFRDKEKYLKFRFPEGSPENMKCVADILESDVDDKYYINKDTQIDMIRRDCKKKFSAVNPEIGITLTARQYANWRRNYIEPSRIGFIKSNSQGNRVYDSLFPGITLSSNGGGRGAKTGLYEVSGRIRRLTPRECARMQGFPESYKITVSDSQAYKQFGNSVAVPCVSAIIREMLKAGRD